MHFGGATDTPVFVPLVLSPLVFKARVGSLICAWRSMCVTLCMKFTSGATPP